MMEDVAICMGQLAGSNIEVWLLKRVFREPHLQMDGSVPRLDFEIGGPASRMR